MRRVVDWSTVGRFSFLQQPRETPKDMVSGISWLYTPLPSHYRPHHTDINCNCTPSGSTISDMV